MKEKGLKLHCMDIGLRDKMGVIIINSYTGGGSAPLAVSIDEGSIQELAVNPAPATGSQTSFTTAQGDLSATAVATGGSGVYTYTWSVLRKVLDTSGSGFSVNSTGTTNAATWNTLTIDGVRPASAGVFDAVFEIQCVVNDGSSSAAVVRDFIVVGEAL